MPKYKYTGQEEQNLANVGIINEGDIIEVTKEQGIALERNAPEQFTFVPDDTPKVDKKQQAAIEKAAAARAAAEKEAAGEKPPVK